MITTEAQARSFSAERCDERGLERIERFIEQLRDENSRQNLVSSASLDHVWQRHIADSLQILDHVPRETGTWLDLGSGAGLPGLVVALARPEQSIILVESRKRRIEWLRANISQFGLTNCSVEGSRLENVETRQVSIITARAFAPLGKLMDLSTRFSTRSTLWVLPKGRSAAQELAEQPPYVRAMFHVEQSRTDPEAAILVGQGRPSRT
ncbi:16S rRNA (guanine(527)-N(7))-methyltransferase RsmG [Aurantiacibacter luteus]|uniref:Ribosomal RNA small subunit methyltransferase G n=1 Tax=Aurantiacibacter luteus TaxID=1581420 RepID=A0A0G9MYH6_9SPHN|nr:16S rRNA (guanine(527)-N(7))-methyltransferase RsmG [Aurantiacibacter luteus]KLE34328.1 16S rRNA methyltransferase [Aurantiacibacter luteus]